MFGVSLANDFIPSYAKLLHKTIKSRHRALQRTTDNKTTAPNGTAICKTWDYWQGGVSCISGTFIGVSGTISDLNNPLIVYSFCIFIIYKMYTFVNTYKQKSTNIFLACHCLIDSAALRC